MPIDKALEEIENKEDDKKIQVVDSSEGILDIPGPLLNFGHIVLGNYISGGLFENDNENIKNFLKTFGPFLIHVLPMTRMNKVSDVKQKIITRNLDDEIWSYCLKKVGKGYLANTDIAEGFSTKLIPGYDGITNKLGFGDRRTPNVHPYSVILGMEPKYRFFMTAAIEVGVKKGEIKNVYHVQGNDAKLELIRSNVPSLESISEVAETYNLTKIKPILEDYERILDEYKQAWN